MGYRMWWRMNLPMHYYNAMPMYYSASDVSFLIKFSSVTRSWHVPACSSSAEHPEACDKSKAVGSTPCSRYSDLYKVNHLNHDVFTIHCTYNAVQSLSWLLLMLPQRLLLLLCLMLFSKFAPFCRQSHHLPQHHHTG